MTKLATSLTILTTLAGHSFCHAVWITNYTSVGSNSATGVWRDVTVDNTGAGIDSGFIVNMTTNGEVKPTTDPTQPSRVDESFPWRDISAGETFNGQTAPGNIGLPFFPQVSGDFANIQTNGSATSLVTFNLGARVTNPVLSFSDIDEQTTLQFTDSFSILTQTTNLSQSGNSVGVDNAGSPNTGFEGIIFGEEAAGSIQFTGTFTQLQFNIVNSGQSPIDDDDRTGFVITSATAPVAIPEPSAAMLGVIAGLSLAWRRRR